MASRNKARLEAEGDVDVGDELEQLERVMDRVKVLYEQHFMGILKTAPETLHRQIERRMLKLTQHQIRNTGLRFRFTTLSQKFGAYNTYWRRTMRAIQQGRYTKHLQLAARRRKHQGKEMPEEMLANLPKRLRERIVKDRERIAKRADRESDRDDRDDRDKGPAVIRQAVPHRHEIADADAGERVDFDAMFDAIQPPAAKPPAAKPPAPVVKPVPRGNAMPPGMSEHQTRALFDQYVAAKKLCGESTDKISYGKLLRTLNKQAPVIMKQHGAKSVDFQVVIKEDKVVLKAVPKK